MPRLSHLLLLLLLILTAGAGVWIARMPRREVAAAATTAASSAPIRLGIVPERDIFVQRKRYKALADYLSGHIGRPVEVLAVNSYDAVLRDFAEKQVDGAFLGSLVAVLAMDQQGARVLLRPELPNGTSTYRGVIFVPDASPVRCVADLAGKRVAMIRTTTAGHLFPVFESHRCGILNSANPPIFAWAGTHDEVMREVLAGRADAGSVKDLRLADFGRLHPQFKVRTLAQSEQVPENALLVRHDLDSATSDQLSQALQTMAADPAGRKALQAFGAAKFIPCAAEDFAPVRKMIQLLGPAWPASSK